jgi:hypothetical protein
LIYGLFSDCGNPQDIIDGNLLLLSNTTYGSSANVDCDEGFESNKQIISCQGNGLWEIASCIRKGKEKVLVFQIKWQFKDISSYLRYCICVRQTYGELRLNVSYLVYSLSASVNCFFILGL